MDRIQERFDELDRAALKLNDSKGTRIEVRENRRPHEITVETIDEQLFVQWKTSVASLLARLFGDDTPTCAAFLSATKSHTYGKRHDHFDRLVAVFRSAKEEYQGGYLFDVRNLVHAEVFSDELEQAEHFLNQGYKTPAAVTAGVVLETTLHKLCEQNGVDVLTDKGKEKTADTLIADLAKQNVFNKMRADQLRAWMKTRNSAAHGQPDEFTDKDVELMIQGVRDFVANQLS